MSAPILHPKPSRRGGLRRVAVIALVAVLVAVPGALLIRYWPRGARPARVTQAPAVPIPAPTPGVANPLGSFDLRDAASGAARIKLWVTPPGSPLAYGVEFAGKPGQLTALISRRGSAEHFTLPMAASWIERLNDAVRKPSAPLPPGREEIIADMVVERPGEVPGKYAVRLDVEGAGWAVLEEILSHYGLAIYVVRPGDTPAKIAQKILGDSRRAQEILEMNPGLKPDRLRPGDAIHVPKR